LSSTSADFFHQTEVRQPIRRKVTEELSSKELEDWRDFCIERFRTKNSFKQFKVKLKILKHREMDDKTRPLQVYNSPAHLIWWDGPVSVNLTFGQGVLNDL
jgi:hypothetical protein